MMLESQLAVGFLDIRLIGVAGDAQDFVVISLHHFGKCFLLENINILGINVKLDRKKKNFRGSFYKKVGAVREPPLPDQ
jgi:hypothetical protein